MLKAFRQVDRHFERATADFEIMAFKRLLMRKPRYPPPVIFQTPRCFQRFASTIERVLVRARRTAVLRWGVSEPFLAEPGQSDSGSGSPGMRRRGRGCLLCGFYARRKCLLVGRPQGGRYHAESGALASVRKSQGWAGGRAKAEVLNTAPHYGVGHCTRGRSDLARSAGGRAGASRVGR